MQTFFRFSFIMRYGMCVPLLFLLFFENSSYATTLKSAKVGNHEKYARIVLRFNQPLEEISVLQKTGKEVVFEIKGKKLLIKKAPLGPSNQIGLITDYSIVQKGGKTLLTVKLSKTSRIHRFFDLPGTAVKPYRLVIDIHRSDPFKLPLKSAQKKKALKKTRSFLKKLRLKKILKKPRPLKKRFLQKKTAPLNLLILKQKPPPPVLVDRLDIADKIQPDDTIETLSSKLHVDEDPDDMDLEPQISECPTYLREPLKIPTHLDIDILPLPLLAKVSDKPVIVIDPGHGGHDSGTTSKNKIYEKDVTLQYARLLQKALNETGKYTVLLTRIKDTFVPLRERFFRAQEVGAHVFISLHADYHRNTKLHGMSVYVLSDKASDLEAQNLADRENEAAAIPGLEAYGECPMETQKIITLSQKNAKNDALLLQKHISALLPEEHHQSLTLKRSADLAVLKAPNIPSVLIELGYLSNKKDEKKIMSKDYQNTFIAVMLKAIDSYFDEKKVNP